MMEWCTNEFGSDVGPMGGRQAGLDTTKHSRDPDQYFPPHKPSLSGFSVK